MRKKKLCIASENLTSIAGLSNSKVSNLESKIESQMSRILHFDFKIVEI